MKHPIHMTRFTAVPHSPAANDADAQRRVAGIVLPASWRNRVAVAA